MPFGCTDIGALINPDPDSLVRARRRLILHVLCVAHRAVQIDGTDIHAIQQAAISITPLRAAFAMADIPDALSSKADAKGLWKL
jgi:broad specificity polyphosphatase/5'/3'-nucleotidase SurE